MSFPHPQYVQFYPTRRCNQKCSFCFNGDMVSAGETASDISYDNALRLIEILSSHGIKELDIMGGEPLLVDWIPEFIHIAARKNIGINISTNGSMPDRLRGLAGIDREKLAVGISLEGSTAQRHNRLTGASNFDAAMQSIRLLVSSGLDPVVKTVVSRDTMDDIQNIVCLLRARGVKHYYIIHMDLLTKDPALRNEVLRYTDFLEFYENLKKANPEIGIFRVNASCFQRSSLPGGVRCAGGVLKLSVLPDGSVFPCNLFHHFKEFNLGNIFKDGLETIWADPRLDYFRNFKANACGLKNCVNKDLCTGGCPAHGYYHYRKLDSQDIRCVIGKGLVS